jgi:hypothetical protein
MFELAKSWCVTVIIAKTTSLLDMRLGQILSRPKQNCRDIVKL